MLEVIKQIAKYPLRVPSAFTEAVKKARESNDSGFFEKLGIFFSSFTDALAGIDKERGEVTEGTEAAVRGSITKTLKRPHTALKLKHSSSANPALKQGVDKLVATAASGFTRLDRNSRAYAGRAINKMEKRLKGESVSLTYKEVTSLGATAAAVLLEMKRRYPTKAGFKKALDAYLKASEGSNFPLKKMMRFSTLRLFKLNSISGKLKLLGALGLRFVDLSGLLALRGLTNSPIQNERAILGFFKKNILRNTTRSNISLVIRRINEIALRGSSTLTTEDITQFAFLIDDADLDQLISILTK